MFCFDPYYKKPEEHFAPVSLKPRGGDAGMPRDSDMRITDHTGYFEVILSDQI